MRSEDLTFDELIHFSDGVVDMHGRRLIIHDFFALGQLQRDLIKMFGQAQAKRVIIRFGYFWGQTDASAMRRIFKWDSREEMMRAGPRLQSLQGVAKTEMTIIQFDETRERYHLEFTWENSGAAEAFLLELGKSDEPVCWFLVGYASGYASFCLEKSVYFIEQECRAAGGQVCRAVGKDIDSWGNEIKPHLDYFHADDIHGKILKLSSQIREMEGKLALQNKLMERALSASSLGVVEIRSLQFQQILNLATKVAKFDSSVLLTGETGVGKDMMSRYIHQFSPRSQGPFVAVNCAALSDTLLESELFGHKAGSFTGAIREKRGLFEEAQNGVIFLDEIGDISQNMQSKLLRVLQEREILKVGDTKPIKVDFRLLSATNRDLEEKVSDGSFREDLFYRLQVIHIHLPPLRERREDIIPLARHFIKKSAKQLNIPKLVLDTTCIDYLIKYSWPGNIRELENAIEHAAILCSDGVIFPEHLPAKITRSAEQETSESSVHLSLDAVEMEHIQKVLTLTDGNRDEAARILKIGVATLYRKLARLKQL